MLPRNLRLILWIIAVIAVLAGHRFWLGFVGMAALFVLLCTTPANAIRLPRWISEIIIFGASVVLQRIGDRPIILIHMAIVVVMLAILRLWRQSPWWAVLYAFS